MSYHLVLECWSLALSSGQQELSRQHADMMPVMGFMVSPAGSVLAVTVAPEVKPAARTWYWKK
jgi:hypothetical protein